MSSEEEVAAKAAEDEKKAADAKKAAEEAEEAKSLGLGDAGKEAIRREREARDAAVAARKAAEKRAADLEKQVNETADAKRQADEADAVRRGEFEKLATERAEEVKAVKGERDDFKARYDRAIEIVTPGVEADWKTLPKEVTDLYEGGDDDVLAKAAHLHRTKGLVKRLTDAGAARGNGPDPRPNGAAQPDDDKARLANARRYG